MRIVTVPLSSVVAIVPAVLITPVIPIAVATGCVMSVFVRNGLFSIAGTTSPDNGD